MKALEQSDISAPVSIGTGKQKRFRNVTYEWLYFKYIVSDLSASQIAREIEATQPNVRKWLRGYGLTYVVQKQWRIKRALQEGQGIDPDPNAPPAPVIIKRGTTKCIVGRLTREWLYYKYITCRLDSTQIEEQSGISRGTICRWLRKHAIPIRSPSEYRKGRRLRGEANPAWRGGKSGYQRRQLKASGCLEQCEWCGATKDLQIHHIDHDKWNGSLENIMWLCGYCNRLESNAWALQKRGRAKITIERGRLIVEFTEVI